MIKRKYDRHDTNTARHDTNTSRHDTNTSRLDFQYCDFLNISICNITETDKSIVVNVYNPIARPITSYIRIPVNSKLFVVLGSKGEPVKSQLTPISKETAQLRRSHREYAAYELVFEVSTPGLGFSTYFVNLTKETRFKDYLPTHSYVSSLKFENDFIENDKLRLEFSIESGRIVRMIRKDRELTLSVDQQFFWYQGSTGNDESKQTSGAYIFRPDKTDPYEVCNLNKAKVQVIKGPLVEEVRQTFGTFVSQVIRLYRSAPYAEFEHTVGPIPLSYDNLLGKEIITRFDTNIASNGFFYTDANGREMKERKRDYRPTWKLKITEPVSENYYPVNSRILINDTSAQFTVMSDRSAGGTSFRNGQVELMLHRRLLYDDFLGVAEALNEPGTDGKGLVTRGIHRVLLTSPDEGAGLHRQQGELMMLAPYIR